MNPQNPATNQTSGLSLPPVDPAQQQAAVVDNSQPAQPAAQDTPGVAQVPTPQAQPAGQAQVAGAPQQPAQAGTPQIADDTDLIEKEWVEKAKQIVEQTKADPYQQNKAMNRFKADYIKKRYNKDVKLDDE